MNFGFISFTIKDLFAIFCIFLPTRRTYAMGFAKNKVINLTRKQRKFFCLERATIALGQGASEDKKFAASLTQLNMTLFIVFGIMTFF